MAVRLTWGNPHFYTDSRDPRIEKTVDPLKAGVAELRLACQPYSTLLEMAETLTDANPPRL